MINFNLSLKYYILPYGTNIGGLNGPTDNRGCKILFSKFDALSTKLDAFLTPGYGCRPFFILNY